MRSEPGLVWLYIIGSENAAFPVHGDLCRGGQGDPRLERLLLADVGRKGVGLTGAEHRFKNALHASPVIGFEGSYLDHIFMPA